MMTSPLISGIGKQRKEFTLIAWLSRFKAKVIHSRLKHGEMSRKRILSELGYK